MIQMSCNALKKIPLVDLGNNSLWWELWLEGLRVQLSQGFQDGKIERKVKFECVGYSLLMEEGHRHNIIFFKLWEKILCVTHFLTKLSWLKTNKKYNKNCVNTNTYTYEIHII